MAVEAVMAAAWGLGTVAAEVEVPMAGALMVVVATVVSVAEATAAARVAEIAVVAPAAMEAREERKMAVALAVDCTAEPARSLRRRVRATPSR